MDMVVVWWSFAVTGGSSEAECHLGLVLGHVTDLVVVSWSIAVTGGGGGSSVVV